MNLWFHSFELFIDLWMVIKTNRDIFGNRKSQKIHRIIKYNKKEFVYNVCVFRFKSGLCEGGLILAQVAAFVGLSF